MKKSSFVFIFSLTLLTSIAQNPLWTVGTAYTLDDREFQLSIFEPAAYGITDRLEVQSFVWPFIYTPNIFVKYQWSKLNLSNKVAPQWVIGSRHGMYYPTILLKKIQKRQTNYPSSNDLIIPKHTQTPSILAFQNELYFSRYLKNDRCEGPNYLLTIKLGLQFAKEWGESTLPTINYPIFYPRTAIYHDTVLWYIGLDFDAHLNEYLNYCVDVEFLSVDWDVKDFAIEHKAMIIWPVLKRMSIIAGYKLSYGSLPLEKKLMFMPVIDLMWNFNHKPRENGLFKNGKIYNGYRM